MGRRRVPADLKQIADPPPYLIPRGVLEPGETSCVAVVGARAASEAGLGMAERLGFELAAHGFVVVSGLAAGSTARPIAERSTLAGARLRCLDAGSMSPTHRSIAGSQTRSSRDAARS